MFNPTSPGLFVPFSGNYGDDEGGSELDFLQGFTADRFFKEKGDYEDRMRRRDRQTDILDIGLAGMSRQMGQGNYGAALSSGLGGIAAQGLGNLARDLFR